MRRRRHLLLACCLVWGCKETRVITTKTSPAGKAPVSGKEPVSVATEHREPAARQGLLRKHGGRAVTRRPGPTGTDPSVVGKRTIRSRVVSREKRPASGYVLKRLSAGVFQMGSKPQEANQWSKLAHPSHPVTISRPFYLGMTEVPQWLYVDVLGSTHSLCRGPTVPVHNVRWYDAVRFANALSRREGLEACYTIKDKTVNWPRGPECAGYRLPTEAEWEYAARAGTPHAYAGSDVSSEVAWYDETEDDACAHPVAKKKPNAWGLFDMSGNVWEWVWDRHGAYPGGPRKDPVGPATGKQRIRRGGSWHYPETFSRVAYRCVEIPSRGTTVLGFRLARTAPTSGAASIAVGAAKK